MSYNGTVVSDEGNYPSKKWARRRFRKYLENVHDTKLKDLEIQIFEEAKKLNDYIED